MIGVTFEFVGLGTLIHILIVKHLTHTSHALALPNGPPLLPQILLNLHLISALLPLGLLLLFSHLRALDFLDIFHLQSIVPGVQLEGRP